MHICALFKYISVNIILYICFNTTFLVFLLILSETMIYGFLNKVLWATLNTSGQCVPGAICRRARRGWGGGRDSCWVIHEQCSAPPGGPEGQKQDWGCFLGKTKCKAKDILFTG